MQTRFGAATGARMRQHGAGIARKRDVMCGRFAKDAVDLRRPQWRLIPWRLERSDRVLDEHHRLYMENGKMRILRYAVCPINALYAIVLVLQCSLAWSQVNVLQNRNDLGGTAMVEDARAQAFLMEGKNADAERTAREAVKLLSGGGEQVVLAEALTTYGKALARIGKLNDSKTNLERASEIAQVAGDPNRGGIAAVTAIEELGKNLSGDELKNYYRSAEALLSESQNRELKIRLGDCARLVLAVESSGYEAPDNQPELASAFTQDFSLESEVLRYEGNLIRQALEASGGSVTRAARLLGVTHQGLAFILNGRHSDLLSVRTPVKKRRRSIIRYH